MTYCYIGTYFTKVSKNLTTYGLKIKLRKYVVFQIIFFIFNLRHDSSI